MFGIQTDGLETAGGVFMTVMALGSVWLGGRAVLRPHRPPQPIEGPVWVARTWGLAHVLLGIGMAARMTTMLAGKEPAWPMAVLHWAAGPLLIFSVIAACVSQWRARRRTGGAVSGRHRRHK
ncbi:MULTISPECIES: hypothetical protein [unclassified Streptomyces]|uniref:hypothetical protein n=1 Tax=unclassified Streptomyces TaxID=2593676 RepID=UPI0016601749|nr:MULTISPECIES: hypothetical protein [unclassified Streptomyces]MBD0708788.1 hypothetical protein [Streptomyces sp. CBMA291]MBD0714726.1 hypothetical protein [Streptomyces sp. CBMA370]